MLRLDNSCQYVDLDYQPEQPSSYLDIFLRKLLKTKVKTMYDFIQLTKRVIVHMGSVKAQQHIVHKMLEYYTRFKKGEFYGPGRVVAFYILLRMLSDEVGGYLLLCEKTHWFSSYSCSDLRLFQYLTSTDQKCGLVDAKLLGMIQKTISDGDDQSNYYLHVMSYMDLSRQKGLNWSGLELNNYEAIAARLEWEDMIM